MGKPKLIIGNKNYSSWSLRAWLILTKLGIEFEEVPVLLFSEGYKEELLRCSPAGKVPIYIEDELVVWDTLAIAEYLAEKYPTLWPSNVKQRAQARSISAEMHSGFFSLRGAMPMNCRAKERQVKITLELRDDIQRIKDIWTKYRNENAEAGSWLFGSFSIADAMFAPVVFRFNTYGVSCDSVAGEYMNMILNDSDLNRWYEAAKNETAVIEEDEVGIV